VPIVATPAAPLPSNAASTLAAASACLQQGRVPNAIEQAENVLRCAIGAGDRHQEATALALLAHCDRLSSQLRRAIDRAQQAMHIFRSLKDFAGETTSLATLCFASSCLGRGEDAVEAGMLCIRLSEQTEGALHQAIAYNNLGVALLCSQRFDDAMTALRVAESLARNQSSTLSPAQPLLNMVCAEAFRLMVARHYAQATPDPRMLARQVRRYDSAAKGGVHALQPGMDSVVEKTSRTFDALRLTWEGKTDEAQLLLNANLPALHTTFALSWICAVDALVRSEIARSACDYKLAVSNSTRMVELAESCQHEHLACLALMECADLYLLDGQPEKAAAVLKTLRRKEQSIRLESIRSRERSVQMQIESRFLASKLEQLTVTAEVFERMCFEDALTGLPNRRRFDHAITQALASARSLTRPPFMSFIDVDRFKQVNDEHSHKVGDEVLRAVARIMVEVLDGAGVAYRIAGDEFAILFASNQTELEVAHRCRTLRDAVARYGWATLSQGLNVTLSIGTSAYRPDDNASSWLERCDSSMYRAKRSSRHKINALTTAFANSLQ
jgi:diguanylate cyclase (GGDEF)-like protein